MADPAPDIPAPVGVVKPKPASGLAWVIKIPAYRHIQIAVQVGVTTYAGTVKAARPIPHCPVNTSGSGRGSGIIATRAVAAVRPIATTATIRAAIAGHPANLTKPRL
jgi:hypothetical protein